MAEITLTLSDMETRTRRDLLVVGETVRTNPETEGKALSFWSFVEALRVLPLFLLPDEYSELDYGMSTSASTLFSAGIPPALVSSDTQAIGRIQAFDDGQSLVDTRLPRLPLNRQTITVTLRYAGRGKPTFRCTTEIDW